MTDANQNPAAPCFLLRICQHNHAATNADAPPIRKTKPIESFAEGSDISCRSSNRNLLASDDAAASAAAGSPKNEN